MSKLVQAIVVVSIILLVCLGLLFMEAQTKILRRVIDDWVYDNKHHYLPCEQLPTDTEVSAIIAQHQNLILAIEQVHPGYVGMEVDTATCPGKADLLIWYGAHQERLAIEALIDGETFFGVPYRLQNR